MLLSLSFTSAHFSCVFDRYRTLGWLVGLMTLVFVDILGVTSWELAQICAVSPNSFLMCFSRQSLTPPAESSQSLRRVNSGPAATTLTKSVSTSSICKWFHADKKDAAPRLFVTEDCDSLIRGWDGGQKRRDWGLQRTTSRSGGARMSSKPFSLTLLHYGQWYLPLELPCREISCVNVNERGR